MAPLYFPLSDLKRSKFKATLIFDDLHRLKEKKLGHISLLNIYRKSYMLIPVAPSHLTLVTLNSQSEGQIDYEGLYLVMEPSEAICYC